MYQLNDADKTGVATSATVAFERTFFVDDKLFWNNEFKFLSPSKFFVVLLILFMVGFVEGIVPLLVLCKTNPVAKLSTSSN